MLLYEIFATELYGEYHQPNQQATGGGGEGKKIPKIVLLWLCKLSVSGVGGLIRYVFYRFPLLTPVPVGLIYILRT